MPGQVVRSLGPRRLRAWRRTSIGRVPPLRASRRTTPGRQPLQRLGPQPRQGQLLAGTGDGADDVRPVRGIDILERAGHAWDRRAGGRDRREATDRRIRVCGGQPAGRAGGRQRLGTISAVFGRSAMRRPRPRPSARSLPYATSGKQRADSRTGVRPCLRPACSGRCSTYRAARWVRPDTDRTDVHT